MSDPAPHSAAPAERMAWDRLLSPLRFRGPGEAAQPDHEADQRSAFQKDADRVLYSSPFRRLQDKTQVHPMAGQDYIRTRLTHSLEVSSVGRSLGVAVGQELLRRHPELARAPHHLDRGAFGEIVAAACLAHDLGNPPFGHAGEDAIRHWFAHDGAGYLEGLNAAQAADLLGFEGNAQGFRIVTRLSGWREQGGLQLTCASIGAFMKYPWPVLPDGGQLRPLARKFGYFQEDRPQFDRVTDALGLIDAPHAPDRKARHPFAFLVEAADDICYLTVDVEDGFKAGRLPFETAERLLRNIVDHDPLERYGQLDEELDRLAYLRAKAIGSLINQTVITFLDHEADLLAGRRATPIIADIPHAAALEEARATCVTRLYMAKEKAELEIAGSQVIATLLGRIAHAMAVLEGCGWDESRLDGTTERFMRLLPRGLRTPPDKSRYAWLLRLTDHISGMTDRYAVSQYKLITGLGLPDL